MGYSLDQPLAPAHIPMGSFERVFFYACRSGDEGKISELIANSDVNPTMYDNLGLENACQNGHLDVVKVLLQKAQIDLSNNIAPLIRACINGHLEIVKTLLKETNTNPSLIENNALIQACIYDQIEIVWKLLKDPRVDPSAQENRALHVAIQSGNLEIVRLLLHDKRFKPERYNEAFILACSYGNLQIVQELASAYPIDFFAPKNDPLRIACSNGNYEIVNYLLQSKEINPSYPKNEALRNVIYGMYGRADYKENYRKIFHTLMKDTRTDPSDSHNEAIIDACMAGNEEAVQTLLKDPRLSLNNDERKNQAVIETSSRGHRKILQLLLEDGRIDPSYKQNQALISASQNGYIKIIRELLKDSRVQKELKNMSQARLREIVGALELKNLSKQQLIDRLVG